MFKVAFMTLGCKVNQADTAGMEGLFKKAGCQIVDFTDEADAYIVNTCVVTNTGQAKSRQMIRRAARKNPGAVVAVAGCYPQSAPGEVLALEGVDLILGNQDRSKIVDLVLAASREKKAGEKAPAENIVRPWEKETAFEELAGGNRQDRTRAYLKVQEGCRQFCSYCIIPYARGPLRSRSLESIREEIGKIVAQGYKEAVLIGIHLGCYGKETGGKMRLSDAIKAALGVKGLERLRLGSLESVEVEDELLDLMQKDARLCPHLHLPLQSGCDKTLAAMNRPYGTKEFKAMLDKIREKIPHIAVTTDIIAGFPGETEEDFAATLSFAKSCAFAGMHVFPYSRREGTPAAKMKEQVPENVKQQRAAELLNLAAKLKEEYMAGCVGSLQKVLVEQRCDAPEGEDKGLDWYEGLTGNYVRTLFAAESDLRGQVAGIKISGAAKDHCLGYLA